MKSTIILICIFYSFLFQSCIPDKSNKGIDPFYTSKSYGDIPTRPLLKPLTLGYYKKYKKWYIDIPHYFNQNMTLDSIVSIGVDEPYIHGNIFERKYYVENYDLGEFVYASKYAIGVTISKELIESKEKRLIYPIDSINKIFLLPERWFVINVSDSTTEAFFSKKKYQNHLKERGISGRMYNIDSINRAYRKTGILPWFPDSIKVKLKKSSR